MMSKWIKSLFPYIILILSLKFVKSINDYDRQPKIHLRNGDLILEAAYDRNISLHLSHDSSLFVNSVNLMDKIRQRYTSSAVIDSETKQTQQFSTDEVKSEIQKLHDDLERFAKSLITFQNRTRRTLQLGVILRNLGRINRLNGRLLALERKLRKDECAEATEPCKNGGTCYDSYNGFHCECTKGYTGKTCEEDVDECYLLSGTDLGCQNNAVCINTPGSYKCICGKGFSGTHCRLRNAICHQDQSQELCAHGTCVPANNAQGYTCICEQGWRRNTTSTNSTNLASLACDIDINECEESSNPCYSECINLPGSFKCGTCPRGYTGNGMTCFDINECAINNGGCSLLPKVRCTNTEGSYRCGNCPPGWLGDGHTCELAPTNLCNNEKICHPQAKCEYISDVPSCTCPPGMFGHGFGPQGCHTNPINDSCVNHLCQNNGTCVSMGRTTSCLCPTGYSGALCETADGCHPNPCENDATCKPLGSNSFKCNCQSGTTGKRCEILRSVCAKTMRRPSGELKYPTDESPEYSFNERCAWIIRTNPNHILNVTFSKFDLEQSTDCINDWLQIHDGNSLASQLIGRFCGQDLPLGGTILSSHNLLFFWFRSNNATNRPGFEMSWVSQPYICGENLELSAKDVGVIKSPGYPGKTQANRECEWELSAPYGYRFVIRIYDINLGTLLNCTGDALKIYDADLLLKEYCQTSNSDVLRSSSNKLLLHFHTDRFFSDSSFQLHYEVEPGIPHCGGLFTEPTGFILGPSEQATCLYLIKQPLNTQIKWEFLDFKPFKNINCNFNRIEIFDGKTDEAEKLLITCGDRIPEPVVSSSNYMLVRYKNTLSDESNQITVIKAKYSRVCEFRVFGPDIGVLTTPNYPKPYVDHITCTFYIYGPGNSIVLANFTDFSLAESNLPNIDDTSENMVNINNRTKASNLNDDTISYVDVFLSQTNKRRYYKGAPMHLRSERNELIVVFHASTNSEKARGFRLEYSFENTNCGGVFSENKGPIDLVLNGPQCNTIFTADEGNHLKLDLEFSDFKNSAQLLIYANTTNNGDFLLRNVTTLNVLRETFNFNTITLIINMRIAILGSYEFISTTQACGGNFTTLYGALTSPSWPKPYQANLDCIWVISAPLGNKIELQVHNFTLEPTCTGDILEIRNGKFADSPLIGRYCQSQIPSRITSFTNSLYIRFTTDNFVEGPGFYFNWEQTSTGCGGKLNSYKGSIHTPHYDEAIGVLGMNNMNLICDWLIVVSLGSSIDLSITTSRDELEFCRKNNLHIYDGASTLSPLLEFNCTSVLKGQPLQLKSSSNQLLIIYSLSEETEYKDSQFVMDYVTNCNAVIYNYRGVIESPNFPENYPENQKCVWDLRAGRNNKLQLIFSHLIVEVIDMDCAYDYVEILDMKDMDVLKKHRLCTLTMEPITSEGNRLMVRFVSDYSNNKMGFRAEYTLLGCGELMYKEFGYITSPNYPYSYDLDCDWHIEVAPGRQITLTVVEFHIESDQPDCSQNVLLLKETRNSTIELAKECQEQQIPLTITSPANRLYIHFHTSATRSRKYFKAFYHTKAALCGGTFRGTSGYITSTNQPYANNDQSITCIWDISVPESYGILLDFKQFQLNDSPNCTEASMEFSKVSLNSYESVGKFCGSEKPNLKIVHGNHLRVEYKDSGKESWGKFSINYKKECGGLVTKASGYIKALASEECVWEFDLIPGTLINLHILQLDCYCPKNEDGVKTCKNYLGLRKNNFDNDNLEYGNRTLYLCERHETDMVFEVSKLDIFTKYINFQAKYSTEQYSCGGYTESARGTLISPHYPSTYPSNMDCTWTIQGTKGSFLELQFEKMDIAKSEHCNEDYLEIRTWSEGKVLGVYCGSEIPLNTLISYERFWLRFHSSDGSTGKGFVINWSYSHLNELVNDTKGYITNPPVNMVKNDEEPYSWRIIIPRGQFIQLNFNEYNSGLKLFDGFDDTALFVEIPPSPCRFVTSSNVVFLQTDNENFEIFSMVWNVTTNKPLNENATINKCHTEEFIKVHRFNAIRVVSPGYPNGYEPNLHCDWIFKPAYPIEHVAVALYEVDLETIGSCSADYLKISTSVDLLSWHKQEQLCNGSNKGKLGESPFLWVHGTPHIKLDFVTDLSINRTGFLAKVVAKCGSNLTDTVGFIDGKMLSDFYEGPNTECLWHVNVKPSKRVRVQLNYPSVSLIKEDFDEACSTHVLLYDGVDDHAPLIKPGKLCYPQNVTTLLVNSTSNHLTIKYKLNFDKVTPRLARFSNWNLTYREYSECSEEIRLIPEASVVNITSPQYPNVPHPHTECEWRVVAPQGELIQIEFLERFDMNARYCSKEYVELFDGSTSLSRNLGRYCHKPPVLKTTQNMLYIHYLTDIAEPRNGFKARISISKCGGIFNENHGHILSPDYPGSYPSSSECDFVINLQGKNLIRLKFIDMHLPFDETKLNTTDHLEIITVKSANENIPSLFFYGNTTNNTEIQIASNKVIIRFHTFQKTFKYRGFSLKYNSQGSFCAHVITGVSGIINMNLSAKKHYQNTCTWKLTVPKNQKARLEFLNMEDLKMENISNFISFAIYNNFDLSSEILTFTPNTFDPNTIIESTDNLIYIRVMVPRTDLTLRSLKVRYTSNDESACPHNIETDENSGIINIPGTHPEFTGNFYCGIKIKLNEEETIVFNISILTISGYGVTLYPLVFRDNYVTTYYRNNLTQFIHAQSQKTGSISITQNSQNRIHRLKMSYKKYPCGGKMSVANGQQIKNPQATQSDNSNEILCVWNLFKPYLTYGRDKSNEFKLIGNFTFTESCDNEFVEIIEGQWMNRTLAKKICKDNANEALEYTLTKRITLVLYSSTNYQPQKDTFTLSIEKIFSCSSETSVGVAPSSIRIDKSLYKNNQECSWIFYAKPGVYLQIQFLGRFFIENSINCTKDYLEIQKDSDGLWLPEARFCGREVPDVYNISSTRIQIIFRTDSNITADGFEFVVQTHCNLVVNVTSAQPQFIMSPTKSTMSRRRMHCEYEFLGKESNKLIVVRAKFETDSPVFARDSCRLGSMTITKRDKDGVDQIPVQHCKLEFEERAYKYLRFAYDAYVGQKFTLEYAYDTCGGNVTTPTIIRPLKHENENTYAENMNCIWYISAPLEHSIAVRFKYFVTEENYDHLSIYSGPLIKREKLVAKLSGNFSANTPIVVDSNQAVINAISDASDSRKGFEANIVFIANCNERIALTEGNSPVTLARNFKFNSSEEYICKYRITAPKDHRVQVDIKKLQINSANTTCQNIFKDQCDKNCNYLEIFDTPTIQEISVNKFCASTSTNKTFISSKEYATLKLNAAQPGQYNFEIILKMEKTECGLTEYKIGDNEKYKFTFPPNGASQYAANIHCTWRLIATNELEIHFNYIDLQNKSLVTGKCLDYIIVKEPYTSTTLCGRSNNFTINPVKNYENYIDITFHSDDSEEGKGFELVAQRSDACNRTYDFLSKIIKYRGYGKENEICIDTIIVPENYTLNFFINSLYFKNFDCSKLHLKIIDLKTNETLLNRCQNSYLNINLFTTTHAVRIEASQFSAISILYSASERKLTPGCGGIFTASEAQFASPPYENDRNFSECRWDIQIPTVSHVNLHFYEFNMGAVTNCHLDNVKIIEILPNGTEKLLKTLCGPDTPEIIKTSGSHFAIVSKKSPNFDGTGWTLNYNILNSNTDNPTVIINPHV